MWSYRQGTLKMLTDGLTTAVIVQVNDMLTCVRAEIARINKSEIIPRLK